MDGEAIYIAPPAPKVHARDLPVWRIAFETVRNSIGIWPEQFFDELTIRRRILGMDFLQLNDPDGVRHVLTTNAVNYQRPVLAFRVTRPLTGAGVFLAEGEAWRRQRRMLAPVFTPASVGGLLPHFIAAGEAMVRELEPAASANLANAFHRAALDAVMRALFSSPATGERADFALLVRRYVSGIGRPTLLDGFARREDDFGLFTRGRRRFAMARSAASQALIDARRADPGQASRTDVLSLLLAARDPETGESLSGAEIGDQTATLLFAGFETTSRLLFWAAYLLALDTAEQARIRSEVEAFPPERVADLDDLHHWPRLRRTLLEALRLYPPVSTMVREPIGPDVVSGQAIRAGASVWISPWLLHRHRRFWTHPTAFMPDRFSDAPSPWTSVPAFLPFGGGPRICIGASFAMAEAQIVLATLVLRFAFTPASARPVLPVGGITTAPDFEPGFRLEPAGGQ